jgi:PAS domain S-box-containing protein
VKSGGALIRRSDAERDDDTEQSGALAVKIDLDHLVLAENPDAVILVTPAGQVLSWNNGASAIYGDASEGAIGRSLDASIVPEAVPAEFRQMMPGQDGLRLLQRKKARASLADVPIIVVISSAGGERQRQAAIRLGAARFPLRPIEPQKPIDEISACLANGDADGDDPGR